jgi:hypothetical protein
MRLQDNRTVRKYLRVCPGFEGECGGNPHPTERGRNEFGIKGDQELTEEHESRKITR